MSKKSVTMARKYRTRAYSPYSHFNVGAAVVSSRGKIFGGCNVENASYGGTICAERVAITKAISEGETDLVELAIVVDAKTSVPPCGICRQFMAEFMDSDSKIILANKNRILAEYTMAELLPEAFTPKRFSKTKKGR